MNSKLLMWETYTFHIFENVYEPAEDTFLLAENLDDVFGTVLDMGTGCGILAILSASESEKVIATDINPHAVRCAKANATINGVSEKIIFLCGNLFDPIREDGIFDLILFNAPYLPVEESERVAWIDYAWTGGQRGRTIIDSFISHAPKYLKTGGCILLVQSTLSDVDETIRKLNTQGLKTTIAGEKKVSFETITLIKAEKTKELALCA